MITPPVAASLCRAAAARIRKLAEAATPGPWRAGDTYIPLGGYSATVLSGNDFDIELRAWLPSCSNELWDQVRNAWADAAHMAAWDPSRALAVADVLEGAAVEIGALPAGVVLSPLLSSMARLAESFGVAP